MANEKLTSSIEILEDGKLKVVYGGDTVYIQPMIFVDTLDSISRILLKSEPNSEELARVDTTITTIDGVAFSGTFAQLSTAIRIAVKKANGMFLGTVSAGGGGGAVGNVISAANSTSSLLGAGATFTGSWESVVDYTTVAVAVLGSIATDGTLYFDLSTDGGTTFVPIASSIGDASFTVPRILNVVESYVRVRYVNGSTPQTGTFSIETKYSNGQELGLLSAVGDSINNEYPTQVVKAISVGKTPNDSYVNISASGYVGIGTTTSILGIAGVFNSGCIDSMEYAQISTELVSDVDGVLVGSWYTDSACTNLVRTFTRPYSASDGYVYFSAPVFAPYFVYEYTNGAIAQASFYLGTKLSTSAISSQIIGLNDVVPSNVVASLSRVVNNPDFDRNRGTIIGQEAKRKFGTNEAVGNSAFEDIWSGGTPYPFPQSAQTIRVKAGGNPADDAAGLGAETITVEGLDENWNEVSEDITLAGASASASTTALFFRINKVFTKTVGTYGGFNTGNIFIENTTDLNEIAIVPAGSGNTRQAIYTVPSGKTAWINEIMVSVGSGNSADVRMFHIDNSDDFSAPYSSTKHYEWGLQDYSGASPFPRKTFLKFDEKNDIIFDAKRITGSGSATVSVDFDYILTDN